MNLVSSDHIVCVDHLGALGPVLADRWTARQPREVND